MGAGKVFKKNFLYRGMFDKKEMGFLVLASLVLGYVLSFKNLDLFWKAWLTMAGLAFIMLFFHHLGQKLTALFYDCSTETQLWTFRQFGFSNASKFNFAFPGWLIFPILLIILTFGAVKWLVVTTFDAAPLRSRIQRKFADLTEWHLALIALGGLVTNAVIAIVSQIMGYNTFAMLNMYFILYNLLPISVLDGSKIFFGSPMLWAFCVVFSSILAALMFSTSLITTLIAAFIIGICTVVYFYYHIYS